MKQKRILFPLLTFIWLSTLIAQPAGASVSPTDSKTAQPVAAAATESDPSSLWWSVPKSPEELRPDVTAPANDTPRITQNYTQLSPDIDGDGIPNSAEENGWFNNRGGPYYTDPLNPDSDADGLTDGEEQFFNTLPTTSTMPGIYALYNEDMMTKQYYSWGQYGNQYISYNSLGAVPRVIARRGTSFEIGGSTHGYIYGVFSVDPPPNPPKDTSKIQVSGLDPCTGVWRITVAPDAQIGLYDITLHVPPPYDGGWEWRTLYLYVVFELPDDMTPEEINTFVYDDEPEDSRDEVALWTETDEYPHYGNDYTAWAYALRFDTLHYQQWIFEDYIIDRVDGLDNQWEAATALRQAANDDTLFGHPRPLFNSWDVLHPPGCPDPPDPWDPDCDNQCSNIAALLSGYNRAVGIPSRPIMSDWRHGTFDHATEFWVDPDGTGPAPNDWYVNRGYAPHGSWPYPPLPRQDWGYCNLTN